MNQYYEDIERIAEGLREHLQDITTSNFEEFTNEQKIKALEIVLKNYKSTYGKKQSKKNEDYYWLLSMIGGEND